MGSIRSRQGSYGPTDGPRSSCPSVRLPELCYAAEMWADTAVTSRKLITTHRAVEKCLLKFGWRTQHLAGLRGSDLRGMSRLRDPAEYVSKAKHRWAGHMRRIDDRWTKRTLDWITRDAKRPRGRPPTRWGDVFATRMDQLRAQVDTARTSSTSLTKREHLG
ncbi:hypothetical protein RB195_010062 [Necator americanus]|uniref:Uncharacterized protein n=1 Tax=Necator americanus TaxID=51031 RepID=A0ABR1CYM4_NECAM